MDTVSRKTTNESVLKKKKKKEKKKLPTVCNPHANCLPPRYRSLLPLPLYCIHTVQYTTAIKELIQPTKTPFPRRFKSKFHFIFIYIIFFFFFKLKGKVINIKRCKIPVIRIRVQVLSHSWSYDRRMWMMRMMVG